MILKMQRTDKIFNNKLYREHLDEIAKLESDRIFCRHDMDHFIDVAHLMVMICADERMVSGTISLP